MPNKSKKSKTKQRKAKASTGKSRQQKIPKTKVSQFLQPKKFSKVNPVRNNNADNSHKQTCSILDPFCSHARIAKVPDGGPPSFPIQLRGIKTVNAFLTSGGTLMQFLANPVNPILDPFSFAPYVLNTTSTPGPAANSFYTSNAWEVRIVSWGVIIRSQMTASTAKGLMILTTINQPTYGPTTISPGLMTGAEVQTHSLAATTEIAWFSKPTGPGARLFRPQSAFTNSLTDLDWTCLQIEVSGADTTSGIALLTCEFCMNIEFTVGNNALAQAQSPGTKSNPIALQAAKNVTTSVESFVQGGVDAIGNKISSVAMTALEDVMASGFALLGL
jgi:hypothetical protein